MVKQWRKAGGDVIALGLVSELKILRSQLTIERQISGTGGGSDRELAEQIGLAHLAKVIEAEIDKRQTFTLGMGIILKMACSLMISSRLLMWCKT